VSGATISLYRATHVGNKSLLSDVKLRPNRHGPPGSLLVTQAQWAYHARQVDVIRGYRGRALAPSLLSSHSHVGNFFPSRTCYMSALTLYSLRLSLWNPFPLHFATTCFVKGVVLKVKLHHPTF
jgi:hypothetical protein